MTTASRERFIIFNADDLGMSSGINRGIFAAHEHGIVTSASLMVRWSAASEAANYARLHPDMSTGLHLDMGEWVCRANQWTSRYQVVPHDATADQYADETRRQIDRFHSLMGRTPSHLDSHQHCHRSHPLREITIEICKDLRIPLRELASPARYVGSFYGQASNGESYPGCVSTESLIAFFDRLPEGITEFGCHPAATVDFDSTYAAERVLELQTLCDPAVRAAIEARSLRLISFREIPLESIVTAHGNLKAEF